ncbi:MAG TPA: hypothetical protein VNW24_05060 [Stellaceae bacterium]|nr:hypothetical protein [Stellaceae bacterium]
MSMTNARRYPRLPDLTCAPGADLGRQQGNHQLLVDGLAIAFFAIAGIFGIPRDEAEDYLPPQAG